MTKRTGIKSSLIDIILKTLYSIGHPIFAALAFIANALLLLLSISGTLILTFLSFIQYSLKKLLYLSLKPLAFTKKLLIPIHQALKRIKRSRLPRIKLPSLKPSRKKSPPSRPKRTKLRKKVTTLILATLISTILFIFTIYLPILKNLPNPDSLITRHQPLSTKILARDGTLLFKIYQEQNRTLIPLEDIPQSLKLATIAIEDQDFYTHAGFSYRGILRAIRRNIFDDKTQGGSTITQQLIKNALLNPEKTLTRKLKEIVLSVLVEIRFDKNQILEMYFNEVAYGGTVYGVEEASQAYFGKSVRSLSLAESAFLAGLPAAPTTYSPFGAHPEFSKLRQSQVLRRMHQEGFITNDQTETAKSQPLQFAPQRIDITAPHFVMYIKDLLVSQYGEQLVTQGGLEVTTSLDPDIQKKAEETVSREVNSLKRLNISNGAALVTNPSTGEILAMVGSKDYFDFENDGQVNVTLSLRQPGSAIKPINYAVALTNGFTPATIIPDTPICYQIPGQPQYCPRNYDNAFHGNVTLRQALANSYNVPAVKTLSTNSVASMLDLGKKMGITSWDDTNRFGLSLTLGGGEIKMIDMAVAYGTLANQGLRVDLNPILKITDKNGKVIEEFICKGSFAQSVNLNVNSSTTTVQAAAKKTTCASQRVLDSGVSFQLSNILSDNVARTPAFGANSVLNVPNHQVAVKTGTTQNLRDNWTIGYTTDFVVLTWVGNNDNSPMSYVASGITGASPIWRQITDSLLQNIPPHTFSPPSQLIKVAICPITGQLACDGCPSQVEYFLPGTQPTSHCSQEQIQNIREEKQKRDQEKRDRLLEGASTP